MSLPSVSHRAPLVSRRFAVEGKLFSTLSTDVFKVVGKETRSPGLMCLVRGGIPVEDPAAAQFAQRMRSLQQTGLCSCLEVGVDEENVAFVLGVQADGVAIAAGRVEPAEAERRFINSSRLIAKFHAAGFCCGDLSPQSWWINRSGDVVLLAGCGVPVTRDLVSGREAEQDLNWREFLAPEVLKGEAPTPSSDVYSLGCLGRKLLATYISSQKGAYLQGIISAALSEDPALRPTTAVMFIEQLLLARSEHHEALAMPKAQRPKGAPTGSLSMHVSKAPISNAQAPSPVIAETREGGTTASAPKARKLGDSNPIVVGVLGVMVIGSFVLATQLASQHQQDLAMNDVSKAQLEMVVGNVALEQAVRVLSRADTSVAERQLQIERLTNSDDPLAHELLVKSALSASTEEARLLSERGIVERARRLGMLRSAEQGRIWLRGLSGASLPAEYEAVLRLLNANLPDSARSSFLKQVLAHDSALSVRLTAAAGLDLPSSAVVELLSQLVTERTKLGDTKGKSLLALLLADPELAALYSDDIVQRREQFSLPDLTWVLPILADRNDDAIRPMASLALERSAVGEIPATFLELIRDRADLTPALLASLVRASTSKATVDDIAEFGRWIDTGAERALLALCATLPVDDPRALEAFDTMAGRSGSIEPAASMVQWVRESHWADRKKYIQAIGVLSFTDRLSREELESTIPRFSSVLKEPTLLELLVRQTGPAVSSMLVSRFGSNFGMGGLVNLLTHPEKQVRLAAVKGLRDVNEALVLRLIVERYQEEKDEDVRNAYRTNFWVIRDREAGR